MVSLNYLIKIRMLDNKYIENGKDIIQRNKCIKKLKIQQKNV